MPRIDRRRSVRYPLARCAVLFRRKRGLFYEGGAPHKGPVVDINSHGVGFITSRTIKSGDTLQLAFDVPDEVYVMPRGFKLKGLAVWVEAVPDSPRLKRIGCEFVKLKAYQHELIQRLIRSMTPGK